MMTGLYGCVAINMSLRLELGCALHQLFKTHVTCRLGGSAYVAHPDELQLILILGVFAPSAECGRGAFGPPQYTNTGL
jgi:hypothetical protein